MPLDDIAGGVIQALGRFIGQFLVEIVLEVLIKGPGYLVAKFVIRQKSIEPDGVFVFFMGFMFWGVIGLLVYVIYQMM